MKKALVLAVVMLFVLPAVAGAYIFSGTALAPGQTTGSTVVFGTSLTGDEIVLPPQPADPCLAIVDDSRLYQRLIKTTDPGQWGLRLITGPSYAYNTYTLKLWAINTTGAAPEWDFIHNGTTVWTGSFSGSSSTSPAVSLVLDYDGSPQEFSLVAVPEPGSIAVLLSGLAGLAGFGIRRRK